MSASKESPSESTISSTNQNIEFVYGPVLLDENAIYSKVDLVREINKLKKEIYVLTNR